MDPAAALLQVPGYDDGVDDGVEPLSNPPPGHKLLTHQYDSLELSRFDGFECIAMQFN
jgi:hypothetical protein